MHFSGRRKSSLPGAGASAFDPFGATHNVSSLRKGGRLPVYVAAVFFIVFVVIMYGEDIRSLSAEPSTGGPMPAAAGAAVLLPRDLPAKPALPDGGRPKQHTVMERNRKVVKKLKAVKKVATAAPVLDVPESCDLSEGEWVYDNSSYPLYREEQCQFLTAQVTCIKNGRCDDDYQKWRWQPKSCTLPRFDAKLFLERLRGKRFMFVGDSLNRNQWESMVCMVQSALSQGKKYVTWEDQRVVFHAVEYNATVEFYWAPFLVESNSDDPNIHSIQRRIIKAEAIAGHAESWRGVDYLVFNTYIWWMNTINMRVMRPAGQSWEEHDEVVRIEAYRRVLTTWATWVNDNIDPARTSVFFISVSPLHNSPQVWGNPDGIRCAKETTPLLNWHDPLYLGTDWDMFQAAAAASGATARVPITFVDVTAMSELRKDGHTSVHTIRQGKVLTPAQQADPATYADCIHWCLPGVPDTWNHVLYTRILSRPGRA